jgi:hypothetical protein
MKIFFTVIFLMCAVHCFSQEAPIEHPKVKESVDFLKTLEFEHFKSELSERFEEFGLKTDMPWQPKELFANFKNADELALITGVRGSNKEIDEINKKYNFNIKYYSGQFDDCIVFTSKGPDIRSGKEKYYYRTVRTSGEIDAEDTKALKLLLKNYNRVVWSDPKLSMFEKLANNLSKSGVTFIQDCQSLFNSENHAKKKPIVVVYSSIDANRATEIFGGQDGVQIAKVTKKCLNNSSFIIVENISKLKEFFLTHTGKRILVVHNNEDSINQLVNEYHAQTITCDGFMINQGSFLSTKRLNFECVVKALLKTNLSASTLDQLVTEFSLKYDKQLKMHNLKINVTMFLTGSTLISALTYVLHILAVDIKREEPQFEKVI